MRYRSKPVECEAMQWVVGPDDYGDPTFSVGAIVAWVNVNGGEARYEPEYVDHNGPQTPARIAVRTINGWAYAAPGHYVVMGSTTFCAHDEYGQPGHRCEGTRDFYPCDPETFERRWEAIA